MSVEFVNGVSLMQGDCLERMKEIPDGSVDMILADLPYGTTACEWDARIPFEPLWEQYKRVCKNNGVVVLFGSEPFSTMLRMSNINNFRYDWIWEKATASGHLLANKMPLKKHEIISVFYSSDLFHDTTNYFQESKDYLIGEKQKAEKAGFNMREVLGNYMGSHYFTRKTQFAFPKLEDYQKLQTTGFFQREYDEVKQIYNMEKYGYSGTKQGYDKAHALTYNPQMTEGKPYKIQHGFCKQYKNRNPKTDYDGKRYPVSVIKFPQEMNGLHPTQKPVALLEYLIKTYTNEGETVLDNVMGSGSTGVAAVNTGRKFIGIELDEKFYETAKSRIEKAIEEKTEAASEAVF